MSTKIEFAIRLLRNHGEKSYIRVMFSSSFFSSYSNAYFITFSVKVAAETRRDETRMKYEIICNKFCEQMLSRAREHLACFCSSYYYSFQFIQSPCVCTMLSHVELIIIDIYRHSRV